MRLHVGARSWLIYRTIAKLEEELDPETFIRVHRSVIVRRDTITGLSRDTAGHWAARLSDGHHVRIGRSHIGDVKKLAGRG
jgi:DNA-binding LytR/AlgR family response regulator